MKNLKKVIPVSEIKGFHCEDWKVLSEAIKRINAVNKEGIIVRISQRDITYKYPDGVMSNDDSYDDWMWSENPSYDVTYSPTVKEDCFINPKIELNHAYQPDKCDKLREYEAKDAVYGKYTCLVSDIADAIKERLDFMKENKDFLVENGIESEETYANIIEKLTKEYDEGSKRFENPAPIVPDWEKAYCLYSRGHDYYILKISNQDESESIVLPLESAMRFKIETNPKTDESVTFTGTTMDITTDIWYNNTPNEYLHYFSAEGIELPSDCCFDGCDNCNFDDCSFKNRDLSHFGVMNLTNYAISIKGIDLEE